MGTTHAAEKKSARNEAAPARRQIDTQLAPKVIWESQAESLDNQFLLHRKRNACACGGTCPRCLAETAIQPKLRIGAPNDKYEQEADHVADQVMRMPVPQVQRQAESEEKIEETEPIQTKPQDGVLQRQPYEEKEEGPLQAKTSPGHTPSVGPMTHIRIQSLKGGGQPLPSDTRTFFESRMGQDFSHVRVHANNQAAETAQSIQAKAYTLGNNIVFNAGQYAPDSHEGKRLLAHELTHVVQQTPQAENATTDPSCQRSTELLETGRINGNDGVVQRQTDYPGFSEEEIAEYDYDPDKEELGEDTGEAAESKIEETGGTKVGKMGRISRKQFLRKTPIPTKGSNIVTTLQFNAWIYVEKQGGDKGGWYKVVSNKGEIGWIPAVAAALDPPEPKAELYKVKPGDKAINLVAQWYKPQGGFSRAWNPFADDPGDARFYVAALAFANKGRAGVKSPDDLSATSAWKEVEVIAPNTIWKPSRKFLNDLKGKVSSGSITKSAWDTAVSVVEAAANFIIGAGAFIGGLVYGALESIYDLFAGVVDLVKMIWDVLVSLFTGNIVSDAKALWENIKKIDPKALWADFKKKWNADSVADRWFFRGRVLGYIIMEIVMLVFSGGVITAIKWVGKFGKIGKLLAKLPKVAELAGKMGRAAKTVKLPEKAVELLKFKKVGKGAKILEGIDKGAMSISRYLKSAEYLQKRAAAWSKYMARGGKKSKAAWEKMYDTLTRNRLKGKLAEEQFARVMKGAPKDIWVKVNGKDVLRKVDNVLGSTAREIKSGPLKLTPFIKKQILKDIELIQSKSMKVEWHLLAGGDAKAIAALKKAGISVILY